MACRYHAVAIGCTNRHFPGTEYFFTYQAMKTRESNGLQQLIEIIGHPEMEQEFVRSYHFTSSKHYYKCNSKIIGFSYVRM